MTSDNIGCRNSLLSSTLLPSARLAKDGRSSTLSPKVRRSKSGYGRHWDNYSQPAGLYLSFADKGNLASVIENWPHEVEITVVTDGSRILGLGDLGINGMGIPVGKLSLYTACAGINPLKTLPITLDLGTNNQDLINDPLYLGSRRPKVTADEEREFLDEMMAALTERWPSIVIQYEDFKNPFPSLERYKDTYTMFNDDIQGTGAVILAGFINAVKQSGVPAKDQVSFWDRITFQSSDLYANNASAGGVFGRR